VPQNSVNGRLNGVNGKKSKYFKKTDGRRPAARLPKSSGGHIKSAQEDGLVPNTYALLFTYICSRF
jgi:hypothetical protein